MEREKRMRPVLNAPVKEGEELEVEITSLGAKGDGITKIDGFIIIVPGTATGDKVKIKVNKVMPRVAFAEKI